MTNPRKYGEPPFRVAVIHGGPGAAGDMAPVARTLARSGHGVLEPLQTAATVQGQVDELRSLLAPHAPVALAGHSWGAWLACLVAPDIASRLVLVGSGPFEQRYVAGMRETRLGRLTAAQRAEVIKGEDIARIGDILSGADDYDAEPGEQVDFSEEIFRGVWPEADAMRSSGELLARTARIRCPVAAIHGDYDAHPTAGVREPLARILPGFEMIELARCGHSPWRERHARATFYETLERLLAVQRGSD